MSMAENPLSQPLQDQPDSKRQKMSTTTTSGDEENLENAPTVPRRPKYKRRKIAIFFAYCGVGYQGMQKNPGAKTIEGDIEEALYHSGAVPEEERGQHRRFDWARSARTDKGVSAVGQVVSGKFYVDPPGFVERLNSNLSPQIRIFGYKRVTPSFSAKKFCDRRRYIYSIPVFALDPSCHRDRETVLASVGSGNELVKCVECSERGRKVFGVMGKRSFESKTVAENGELGSGISSNNGVAENGELGSGISSNNKDAEKGELGSGISSNTKDADNGGTGSGNLSNNAGALEENKIIVTSSENIETGKNGSEQNSSIESENVEVAQSEKMEGVEAVSNDSAILPTNSRNEAAIVENNIVVNSSEKGNGDVVNDNTSSEAKKLLETGAEISHKKNEDKLECEEANGHENSEKKSEFCYGEEEKKKFNRILKYYEGTHNFHNFTTRTKAEDPAAKRYILSFNANTVINIDGIDFVKCEVVGQSFMLHQIRKMIGLAVAIMRNLSPESLIETAFQQTVNVNVPMAPEVGLYLDECFFSSYNKKREGSHEELSMKAYAQEAEEFKIQYIYPHVASSEHKDGSVAVWLHSLNYRNYPDLRAAENTPIPDKVVDDCLSTDAKRDEIVDMDE